MSEQTTFGWSGECDQFDRPDVSYKSFSVGVYPVKSSGGRGPVWIRIGSSVPEPYRSRRVHDVARDIAGDLRNGKRAVDATALSGWVSIRLTKAGRAAGVEVVR